MDGPSTLQTFAIDMRRPARPRRRKQRHRHTGQDLRARRRCALDGVPSEFYTHPSHIAHKTDAPTYFGQMSYEDPLSTMMLVQMLADAYTDSRMEWEANKDRVPQEGDDPAMYGPNEAQRKIERYLVATRFLPRLIPETVVIKRAPRRSQEVQVVKRSRWSHCLQFVIRSPRHNMQSAPTESKSRMRTKLADFVWKCLRIKKAKPIQSKKLPPIILPARPALPRVIPSTKPLLRRMTSADTRALLAASARKKRVPRKVFFHPEPVINLVISPELRVSLGDIDWEDFKTLRWFDRKPRAALKPVSERTPLVCKKDTQDVSLKTRDETPRPSLCITLFLVFVFQFSMFSIMVFMILWGIWRVISAIAGLLFFSSNEGNY